jgi:hypothetical protein
MGNGEHGYIVLLENMRGRHKAFNTIVGFSGLRQQDLQKQPERDLDKRNGHDDSVILHGKTPTSLDPSPWYIRVCHPTSEVQSLNIPHLVRNSNMLAARLMSFDFNRF